MPPPSPHSRNASRSLLVADRQVTEVIEEGKRVPSLAFEVIAPPAPNEAETVSAVIPKDSQLTMCDGCAIGARPSGRRPGARAERNLGKHSARTELRTQGSNISACE